MGPVRRSAAGYRLYDESALLRLRFIGRAKRLGLPLNEVRTLVSAWDEESCEQVRTELRSKVLEQRATIRTHIGDLSALATQLDAAERSLRGPAPDGSCGESCGCSTEPDDVNPALACTLDAAEHPARLEEWTAVVEAAIAREDLDGVLRLTFVLEPESIGRLARLVALEKQCCPFFSFSLEFGDEQAVLEIRGAAEALRAFDLTARAR